MHIKAGVTIRLVIYCSIELSKGERERRKLYSRLSHSLIFGCRIKQVRKPVDVSTIYSKKSYTNAGSKNYFIG